MIPLWFLILLILACLAVAIRPRVIWDLSSWEYKNPEANEPSEAAFAAYRIMGVIGLIVFVSMAIASVVSKSAEVNQRQQIAEQRAAERRHAEEQELKRFREPHDLLASSRVGHGYIVGYWRIPNSKEFRIVWQIHECATLVKASIDESKDAVDIHVVEKSSLASPSSPCSAPRKKVESKIFTLGKRLGDREVRAPLDGKYIPVSQCDPKTVIASSC
ncbi:DUF6199 family natural product biosynthesis protein [Nonomuraea deserti]|uniref:DUF6199 family natural product biosynthesis protein n=1 Tax=Nonomuraea deserti TaxID=1848322 RepID=UPI0026A43229